MLDDRRAPDARHWHAAPLDEALEALDVTPEGLSAREAAKRLREHGPNRLPTQKRKNPILRFLSHFHDVLIYVLLGAAVVTALLQHWIDTYVILGVVVINAIIGFVQEGKAESALDAIRDMLAPKAVVRRDGKRRTIPGEEVVPGDVVLIESGDKAPADLRLGEARRLSMQEAVLTGESVPVEKRCEPAPENASLGDRSSMAYSGCFVATGQGWGVAVATGADTEIGKISGIISGVRTLETPLTRQLATFGKWLTAFILLLAAAILGFGTLFSGYEFGELFLAVVGLSVAAIPEGLPAIVTITLALGVRQMAGRNAIVRRLPAVEALGSVSVICSDKTGTLTRNEMTVASVAVPGRDIVVTGEGYAPHGALTEDDAEIDPADDPRLMELGRAALLCVDADIAKGDDDVWRVDGDPMEGALIAFAGKVGLDREAERAALPRADSIPFDSAHRFMAVLNHDHEGGARIVVKGAPERMLDMCARQRNGDGDEDLDRDFWKAEAERIAARGQRVLAVAVRDDPPDRNALDFDHVEGGLTLLGFVGFIDPPREEAIRAVAECRSAGVGVKMITGDHAATAAAVAEALGIENPDTVLTGADLEAMDDDALRERIGDVNVFARTSPADKLRLVEALQAQGAVIAMTGDGVNDAPALKRADVGVAMGKTGSEAAKEAAEMVLADDNFATIAAAVKAGRGIYDNLKKSILFVLPTNGGQALVMIVAILAGLTLPITPVQILWVNMVTAVTLALALAFEPPEPTVMSRPPRRPGEPLLSGFLVWRTAFVSVLFCVGVLGAFWWSMEQGDGEAVARTKAVNVLVAMEIFYLFAVRHLSPAGWSWRNILATPAVWIAVGLVCALQVAFTYAPPMHLLFDTRALNLEHMGIALGIGFAGLIVVEVEKLVRRAIFGRR
ncbi:MAG: cation-transporting P-type ATPase [Rhodobacteraceae bacterium]|nr:MAG: cation-transporting P-type ATPase [Paracoccaceae bacterium]